MNFGERVRRINGARGLIIGGGVDDDDFLVIGGRAVIN